VNNTKIVGDVLQASTSSTGRCRMELSPVSVGDIVKISYSAASMAIQSIFCKFVPPKVVTV